MKNKLVDLNNHLFAQLERLNSEGLEGEALTRELERAKGVVTVARAIVENGTLALQAQVKLAETAHGPRKDQSGFLLEDKSK